MKKVNFSSFPQFSASLPPRCMLRGSDTNTAVSLPTKVFILVLSVENNKTLNPGRAGEPYVTCSLSSKSSFASFSPNALTFGDSCLLPHFQGSCVIMDRDYWGLVGRGRPQLIIRRNKAKCLVSVACLSAIILHSWKFCLKRFEGPQGYCSRIKATTGFHWISIDNSTFYV